MHTHAYTHAYTPPHTILVADDEVTEEGKGDKDKTEDVAAAAAEGEKKEGEVDKSDDTTAHKDSDSAAISRIVGQNPPAPSLPPPPPPNPSLGAPRPSSLCPRFLVLPLFPAGSVFFWADNLACCQEGRRWRGGGQNGSCCNDSGQHSGLCCGVL